MVLILFFHAGQGNSVLYMKVINTEKTLFVYVTVLVIFLFYKLCNKIIVSSSTCVRALQDQLSLKQKIATRPHP